MSLFDKFLPIQEARNSLLKSGVNPFHLTVDHILSPTEAIMKGRTTILVGTNNYFTELNRERPPKNAGDGTCYSINPQVHAFDNATLVENLEAQASTVHTARSFAGDRWIAVTPVTLRPRFIPANGAPSIRTGVKVHPSMQRGLWAASNISLKPAQTASPITN